MHGMHGMHGMYADGIGPDRPSGSAEGRTEVRNSARSAFAPPDFLRCQWRTADWAAPNRPATLPGKERSWNHAATAWWSGLDEGRTEIAAHVTLDRDSESGRKGASSGCPPDSRCPPLSPAFRVNAHALGQPRSARTSLGSDPTMRHSHRCWTKQSAPRPSGSARSTNCTRSSRRRIRPATNCAARTESDTVARKPKLRTERMLPVPQAVDP